MFTQHPVRLCAILVVTILTSGVFFSFNSIYGTTNGGKVLVISPAGLEKYFKEIAETLRISLITWELEQEIASRYGQEFIENLKHWGQ
jgi:hypothetical protein